jgi:hypothetical protein
MARPKGLPIVSLYHAHLDLSRPVSSFATQVHVRAILPRFSRVVTTSPAVEADLRRWGLDASTVSTGVIRSTQDTYVEGRDILFVGRLPKRHSQKRPDLLLKAMSRLTSDANFTWSATELGERTSND